MAMIENEMEKKVYKVEDVQNLLEMCIRDRKIPVYRIMYSRG